MKVLLLCGGESVERNVSLASGNSIAQWLIEAGHEVVKYDPEHPGALHEGTKQLGGDEIGLTAPMGVLNHGQDGAQVRGLVDAIEQVRPDVVFPILHGGMGEDGTLQAVLEWIGVPFTGSGSKACGIAMNKQVARTLLCAEGIPVAEGFTVHSAFALNVKAIQRRIEETFGLPVVVKPRNGGSTVGLTIVKEFSQLDPALAAVASVGDVPLIEEYFEGKEVTATVVDGECFPLIEIRPREGFYDYANKYSAGKTDYICPAEITNHLTEKIRRDAVRAFTVIGCSGFARVDFLASDREYVCLEINTLPGMTADYGLVPKAARAHGLSLSELIQRIIDCALRDRTVTA